MVRDQRPTDDHAATRPMYAAHLGAVLIERGHLSYEILAQKSLGGASNPNHAADDEPVEATFVRRRANRAAQGSARDNARHSGTRGKAARPPQTVASRTRTAGPTAQGNDPVRPLHPRPENHSPSMELSDSCAPLVLNHQLGQFSRGPVKHKFAPAQIESVLLSCDL